MEMRLLVAYALMIAMMLAVAAIAFRMWYTTRDRSLARQRLRETRRWEERHAADRAAAPDH